MLITNNLKWSGEEKGTCNRLNSGGIYNLRPMMHLIHGMLGVKTLAFKISSDLSLFTELPITHVIPP